MESRATLQYLLFALISVLLQAFLAPVIQIGYAMPNFILCFVAVTSLLKHRPNLYVIAFILGLVYDLMSSGAIGSMALTCVLVSALASVLYKLLNNDSLFVPLILVVVLCFAGEGIYGVLCVACGWNIGIGDALLLRILPCGLYDAVLGLIAYLVSSALFSRSAGTPNEMSIIN